jgi:hypothetical protein
MTTPELNLLQMVAPKMLMLDKAKFPHSDNAVYRDLSHFQLITMVPTPEFQWRRVLIRDWMKTTCPASAGMGQKGRCGMSSGNGDAEKARFWQRTIREASRSGMSIREFCRQQRVKESQFYWWQQKLKLGRQELMRKSVGSRGPASFALVSGEAGTTPPSSVR